MYNLIAVGDALLDTHVKVDNASVECSLDGHNCRLCFDYAAKIPITCSFQALGGNGANVSAGVTKLGLKTSIIASLGEDANANIVREQLAKWGVNTDMISTDKNAQTRYSVVLNFQGERTILSYHEKRKYVWPKEMPATDWIYYTSLSEGFETLHEKILDFAGKHRNIKLAFNPGSYQLKKGMPEVLETIQKTDLLILNLEEAEQILKTNLTKEKSVESLIHKLLAKGANEIVITDAQNGAWAGNEEEIYHLASYPVKVVAKTGAGDAFSAGYLSAKIFGHGLPTALTWGIANSCAVIGQYGAQNGLLDQAGMKKMVKKFARISVKKVV